MKPISISKDHITIGCLPMPPSVNQLFKPYRAKGGKGKRIPSEQYQAFKGAMDSWYVLNIKTVIQFKEWIKNTAWDHNLMEPELYRFDRYFMFHHSKLWTKEGKPKKLDATNRIKAFDDCFCGIIGIDDSFIWKGSEEKITVPKDYAECVIVKISPVRERNWQTLIGSLNQDI